jgi:hypothetical protein
MDIMTPLVLTRALIRVSGAFAERLLTFVPWSWS